ncbi:hypothetical protein JW851_02480 [Candidatus Woesearchaeota archaeon]|nr:hypothetical protein [Candidatus Woesearchaeota archaeon]
MEHDNIKALFDCLEKYKTTKPEWSENNGGVVIVGYDSKNNAILPLQFKDIYSIIENREDIKKAISGDFLIYFFGDKKPKIKNIGSLDIFISQEVLKRLFRGKY